MKRLLACLLVLALLLSTALAEAKVEARYELDTFPYTSAATGYYQARGADGYVLYDVDGNALSAAYPSLSAKWQGLYYEYRFASGLNTAGLLDKEGQVLTEPIYGKITFAGEEWALCYVLEPTTAEVGDMKDSDNNQYMVKYTDVLYNGNKIGTLSREEFDPSLTFGYTGKYLYVRTTSEAGYYVSPSFEILRVEEDFTSAEFTTVYKKGVFHNPSQTWAFCAECTLTPDLVSRTTHYDDEKQQLIGLHGEVIKDGVAYERVNIRESGYSIIRQNRLYGIMDPQGNVVVEPIYQDISSTYDVFANEYHPALTTEGYLHFLNKQGEVVAKAEYPLTSNDYKGYGNGAMFAVVNNMGKYMVFTAEKGQLSETYEDFVSPSQPNQLLRVKKNGLWGAIDLQGNVVIPFEFTNSPSMSDDSTMFYGTTQTNDKVIYKVSFGAEEANESWTVAQISGAEESSAPVLAEGAWECTCGAINTGKFCAECGAKRPEPTLTPVPTAAPAADGEWDCTCGSHNSGKFCPECGSKRPEATPVPEPQCANCGYKPGETTPKFCPECGTKF